MHLGLVDASHALNSKTMKVHVSLIEVGMLFLGNFLAD